MPYQAQDKQLAKEYVDDRRQHTFCELCGRQPIEWHNKEHEVKENRRVSSLVALGFPLHVIQEEIDKCNAYCRLCHMKQDGRLAALRSSCPYKKGQKEPPKICWVCNEPAKPMRHGRCNRCSKRFKLGKGP